MTDHPMCCIFPYIQGGDKDKEKEKEKDYDHEKEKDARPGGPGTGGPAAAGRAESLIFLDGAVSSGTQAPWDHRRRGFVLQLRP